MSDKTIRAGDLVVVVKPNPCCGTLRRIGFVYTVSAVYRDVRATCGNCGTSMVSSFAYGAGCEGRAGFLVEVLIKLRDDETPETIIRDTEEVV